jgi:hypothetical protein
LFLRSSLLNAVAESVLRVLRTPVRLRLLPPRRLAIGFTACVLAWAYSWVGTEPLVADGAGSFPRRGHPEHDRQALGAFTGFLPCEPNFSKARTRCVTTEGVKAIGSVNLVAAGLAIALLVVIVVRKRRHPVSEAVHSDNGPEPTEAELEAAEQSIRSKTADAVQRAKTRVIKSILILLLLALASVPFMHGMPLNPIFQPWGQLLLIGSALAFAWAMIASSSFVFARSFKKSAEKLLSSLHDSD